MNYLTLAAEANRNAGFTYNVQQDKLVTRGFSVAMSKETERLVITDELSHRDIAQYVDRYAKHFLKSPSVCLGAWKSTGADGMTVWYLDISMVLDDEKEALEYAFTHEQLAIYDLNKGQTIFVADRIAIL